MPSTPCATRSQVPNDPCCCQPRCGNPYAIPSRAHSVLTVDLVDEPDHPTKVALDRVMTFLNDKLHPQTDS